MIDCVNKEYFYSHSDIKIRVEMDEMWSFYHDKKHQIWLWRAIDHYSGEVVTFWFGSRGHKSFNKLIELLAPLEIGSVYTDGNYAYKKHVTQSTVVSIPVY
jgi:IS1 family transposase